MMTFWFVLQCIATVVAWVALVISAFMSCQWLWDWWKLSPETYVRISEYAPGNRSKRFGLYLGSWLIGSCIVVLLPLFTEWVRAEMALVDPTDSFRVIRNFPKRVIMSQSKYDDLLKKGDLMSYALDGTLKVTMPAYHLGDDHRDDPIPNVAVKIPNSLDERVKFAKRVMDGDIKALQPNSAQMNEEVFQKVDKEARAYIIAVLVMFSNENKKQASQFTDVSNHDQQVKYHQQLAEYVSPRLRDAGMVLVSSKFSKLPKPK